MRRLWTPASSPIEAGMPIWRPFAFWYPMVVFTLAAVGLVAQRRRWREASLPWLFGAAVIVGALLFYGSPRMRALLEPFLIVMAAGGTVYLIALGRRWLGRLSGSTRATNARSRGRDASGPRIPIRSLSGG